MEAKCTGEENHYHYRLADSVLIWHSHAHTVHTADFNRLHHHSPRQHESLTDEELMKNHTVTKVPW
jgi:hypothetical protein